MGNNRWENEPSTTEEEEEEKEEEGGRNRFPENHSQFTTERR